MALQPDFKELLELFAANHVEYVVVGGHALAFHGAPRYTGDIDLYVRPTRANAERVMACLSAFGFGETGLTEDDFHDPRNVVQLGVPPVRIDLVTSIDGVSWEEADEGKETEDNEGVPVYYLGRRQFIANKRACGRPKDLADLEALDRQERET